MSLRPYPEYKDSGVEWLGEIPLEWSVRRLKTVSRIVTEKATSRVFPVALEHIEGWTGRLLESESHPVGDGVAFRPSDILLGKLRPYLAKVWLASQDGEAVGDFHVLRANEATEPKFLEYLMRTKSFISLISGSTYGAKMPRASWEFVRSVEWAFPTRDEQRIIVSFLDHETAEIDAFIVDQEELIALLNERRSATVTQAVTKGLDPTGPMKNSGGDWFGVIPMHWKIGVLKHLTSKITDGAHISPETEGGVYDFVSTKDLSGSHIDFGGSLKTSPTTYRYMVKTGCQPLEGDVLFSKDGTVGRTVVVRASHKFVVASSLIIIRPDKEQLSPRFLDFLCRSFAVQGQVQSYVKGAGLPRLSIANLLKIVGVFPPIQEQYEIADYLDRETSEIDATIEDGRQAIVLSKERRAALISAAVTGKIDVRDHVSAGAEGAA